MYRRLLPVVRPPFAIVLAIGALTAAGVSTQSTSDSLSGGETTVFDSTRNAYSLPARNLLEEHRPSFFVGNSFFNQNWIVAPASVEGRDGLGPLFNERSCSACHFKDGRGRPPAGDGTLGTLLLRISVPGTDEHGGPMPDRVYGDQIQTQAIPGVPREADVLVRYRETGGRFPDGESFALRVPTYEIVNLGYGPISSDLQISPRVAPAIVGLGLLEAVPESTLAQLAAKPDPDGVSGRVNRVWNSEAASTAVGRFGWKAEQPTVAQQTAAAFAGDIGITSPLVRGENYTSGEPIAARQPTGGDPELSPRILDAVVLYARSLAVPAARSADASDAVRGRDLFASARCTACHVANLTTGASPNLPEAAFQVIHPYTDLLLHDLGEGLADGRPVFTATGREWRTPPLWGLGLLAKVNGHTFLLHDGRARTIQEAILWHGGEAEPSRRRFVAMPRRDRAALLAFLESL